MPTFSEIVPLGWGTTYLELRVLSKMPSVFVNHATGVEDHFLGAQVAVKMQFFCEWEPCVWTFLSELPWPGCVQRGGFLFKEFWTCTVFWPDTWLVDLTKSYVQVAKSYLQVAKYYVKVANSYVQAAKFSSPVFYDVNFL